MVKGSYRCFALCSDFPSESCDRQVTEDSSKYEVTGSCCGRLGNFPQWVREFPQSDLSCSIERFLKIEHYREKSDTPNPQKKCRLFTQKATK